LLEPGREVTLRLWRNGREVEQKVTVGTYPEDAVQVSAGEAVDKLGVKVQALDRALARRYGYYEGAGVVVTAVAPDSPAAAAEIKPGDLIQSVNRKPVSTEEEFHAAVGLSAKTGQVLLRVQDARGAWYVMLNLE